MGQSFGFDIPGKELFLIDDKRNRGLHPYGLKGIKILSADGSGKIVSAIFAPFVFTSAGYKRAEVFFDLPVDTLQVYDHLPQFEKYPIISLQKYDPDSRIFRNWWVLNIQEDYAKWSCKELERTDVEGVDSPFSASAYLYRIETIGVLGMTLQADKFDLEHIIGRGKHFIDEILATPAGTPRPYYDEALKKAFSMAEFERNQIAELVDCWKSKQPDEIHKASRNYIMGLKERSAAFQEETEHLQTLRTQVDKLLW